MVYKVEVYLPKEALNKIKTALYSISVGNVGNYNHCMTWYNVKSCWTPQEGAHPYLGQVGRVEESDEIKLEFRCDESVLREAISLIKGNHPYEEVGIYVIPIYDIDELVKY